MKEKENFFKLSIQGIVELIFNLISLFILAAVCFPLWEMIAVKYFSTPKLTLIEFFGLCVLGRCIFGGKFSFL